MTYANCLIKTQKLEHVFFQILICCSQDPHDSEHTVMTLMGSKLSEIWAIYTSPFWEICFANM